MPPIAGSTTLARVVNPHGDEGGQRVRDCRTVVVLRDLGLDHGDPAAEVRRGRVTVVEAEVTQDDDGTTVAPALATFVAMRVDHPSKCCTAGYRRHFNTRLPLQVLGGTRVSPGTATARLLAAVLVGGVVTTGCSPSTAPRTAGSPSGLPAAAATPTSAPTPAPAPPAPAPPPGYRRSSRSRPIARSRRCPTPPATGNGDSSASSGWTRPSHTTWSVLRRRPRRCCGSSYRPSTPRGCRRAPVRTESATGTSPGHGSCTRSTARSDRLASPR